LGVLGVLSIGGAGKNKMIRTIGKILDTEPFFIKTAAEILDTVRQVFPNARIVREPVSLVAQGMPHLWKGLLQPI
jgi:hypothetical protein